MRDELEAINTHAKQIEVAVMRLTEIKRSLFDPQIPEIGKILSDVVINARGCRTDRRGT